MTTPTPLAYPPLTVIQDVLATGADPVLQIISDSLGEGYGDSENLQGWVGRLGIKFGEQYGCSARIKKWNGTAYSDWQPLFTGTTGQVLSIYNGSVGGQGLFQHVDWITNYGLIVEQPDLIIHGSVANDYIWNGMQAGPYCDYYKGTFLPLVFATCPDAPVVTTSQSPFNPYYPFVFGVEVLRSAWRTTCGFAADPLVPAVQITTLGLSEPVWFFDTIQALGVYNPIYYSDSLHPNPAGYELHAAWMFPYFSGVAAVVPGAPNITTVTLTLNLGVSFNQVLTATGSPTSWAVHPGDHLPAGCTFNAATHTLTGTPSAPGPYSFRIDAINDVGTDTQPFAGEVTTAQAPFVPTGNARFKYKAANMYYQKPIKVKVAASGSTPITLPVALPFTFPESNFKQAVPRR